MFLDKKNQYCENYIQFFLKNHTWQDEHGVEYATQSEPSLWSLGDNNVTPPLWQKVKRN